MASSKVAVLVATYNGEKYLREQIDSLLKQKNVTVDILVRDDGSTDGTINLLNSYQCKGELTWFTGEHMNVADSFFTLLEHSKDADYYAFCDQDDVWDEDKLFCAIEFLKECILSKYALYCCGSRLVDENMNFIVEHTLDTERTQYARLFFSNIAGNSMVINKALRDKIIEYHPQNMILHDTWVYKVALCLGANIVIDKESHLNYRQHGNNVIGMELNLSQKVKKFFEIIKERQIYKQLMEVKSVYSLEMDEEYLNILSLFEAGKVHIRNRILLAFDKRINFNNIFFNIAFKIKILLNSY